MSGSRILIAEDQAIVAMEIEDRLRRLAYDVVGIAASGRRAIGMATELQPDLLLFDIRLNGEPDGVDAAKAILEQRSIPVVFLSAYADEQTLGRVREVEPAAYLLKPFDERMLQIALDTALYKHRMAAERQRAERERCAVEARLAAVLNHSPDAIISVGDDRRMAVFNRGAERTFGYHGGEAVGLPFDVLLADEGAGALFDELAERAAGERAEGVVVRREVTCGHEDGTRFPAEVSLSRAEVDGEVLVTAIVRDVSEQKRLQEKFLHAQKLEAVGRLAAGVAHDFNNLLSAIQCNAFLAGACAENPEQLRAEVAAITRSVRRGAALTRQLLGFAKRAPGTPRPVDLGEAVASLEHLVRMMVGVEATITMNLEVGAGVVEIDPCRLEQAVMNLVVNARDAMPEGGALTFAVAGHQAREPWRTRSGELPAGRYVRLSITDTGIGMEEAVLERIFEPFFTTKGARRGTGLGLPTVLEVVSERNGGVEVESAPGKGTSFHLYLPHSEAALESGPSERSTAPPLPLPLRLSVLVVDDDDHVRPAVARVLSHAGCRVDCAATGPAAVSLCAQNGRYDLAIVDVFMPGSTGRSVAAQLRELDPGMPVLYISGHLDGGAEDEWFAEAPVLRKPFTVDALQAAVLEFTR